MERPQEMGENDDGVLSSRAERRMSKQGSLPLVVQDLSVQFALRHGAVRAVEGVSLQVAAGECVGVVGESGCGKTTTGLAVMQLLPPIAHITSGSVRIGGRELIGLSEHELCEVRGNAIGMVFQDPQTSLNPTMRIGRQIAEVVHHHRKNSWHDAYDRTIEVLSLVGMPSPEQRLRAYPGELSGGLRQRVMIAMALACDPTVLVADEPTTALDVTIQAQILDLLDDLRLRLGMGVLLITHDMGVIAERADRVLVMYAGRIVEEGSTAEIFRATRHRYTEALLDSVPRLDQDRLSRLRSIPGMPPDLIGPIGHCRFAERCTYSIEVCWDKDPPLAQVASDIPGHLVACANPCDDGGGVASPAATQVVAGVARADVAARVEVARRRIVAEEREGSGQSAKSSGSAGSRGTLPTAGVDRYTREGTPVTPAVPANVPIPPRDDHDAFLVEAVGLEKEYPVAGRRFWSRHRGVVHAVSGVSFGVRRGETFALVGESGCGKTTIGRMTVALESATAGSLLFDGSDIQKLRGVALRRYRRGAQLMFQDPYASLDPRMRVGTILREPLAIQGIGDARDRDERVRRILDDVGLPSVAVDRYPHELSGGQRQRVGLARALVLDPLLIVADEPVSALDVSVQAQVLNLMIDLQNHHGLTYIFVTHDLAVARYIADTVGVMYLGKLVEQGPIDAIFEATAHPYTRALLDAVPEPDPARADGKLTRHLEGELPSAVTPPSGCRFRTRCPNAQDVCAEVEPPLRPFGAGHVAACHFPLRSPQVL